MVEAYAPAGMRWLRLGSDAAAPYPLPLRGAYIRRVCIAFAAWPCNEWQSFSPGASVAEGSVFRSSVQSMCTGKRRQMSHDASSRRTERIWASAGLGRYQARAMFVATGAPLVRRETSGDRWLHAIADPMRGLRCAWCAWGD